MADEGLAGADRRIVVVGAGISGLLLAAALKARGESVVVLEKSRGLGGRLATKRVGGAVFDQGAQYFTARQAPFRALVAVWRTRGAVTEWPAADTDRLIGMPSMNAVGRLLAEGLDVRSESQVVSVRREAGHWLLEIDNQAAMRAGRLVLTAPVPQSLALLRSGGVLLPDRLWLDLQALTYHPCLALLVTLGGPSAVPVEGLAPHAGPVRWLADNTKKGISAGAASAVTVHLEAEFSAAHYAGTEAELARLVLPVIEPWLGAPVLNVGLHRWKFSEPTTTYAEPYVWRAEIGLGLAGDGFGGPRVEGAALSALALADRMAETAHT